MIEIREILCPVDFSASSERAFRHAVRLARWYGSRVTLLHAYEVASLAPPVPELIPAAGLTPEYRDELVQALTRFAGAEDAAAVPLRFEIAVGRAAALILDYTTTDRPDLLVMGTHGRSGVERFLLGSVTERLLHKAPCPVLTVPAGAGDLRPAVPTFKQILCAIDFSESSLRALEYATSLAQEADACLTLAHVFEIERALPVDWRETLGTPSLQQEVARLESEHRGRLARAVPQNVGDSCTVETVMVGGTPYREILRLAQERHADVIVAGVHGRNAADLLFFGSTTNHLVRQATCPVLTVRSH